MPRKKPKTKEARPKFPKEIYCSLDPCEAANPDSEKYLSAFDNLDDAYDGTPQEFIATYELVSTARIVRGTTLADVEYNKYHPDYVYERTPMTNLIPVFEFLTLDEPSKTKAKTFIETINPTIESFGIIVRDNKPLEWLKKVLPEKLYAKLKVVGYKTTAQDFTDNLWWRFLNTIDLNAPREVFFEHEHALKTLLESGKSLDKFAIAAYKRFVEVLDYALRSRGRVIHYPGVVRNETEAYQRLYGGLSLAAANAGALVCDSSLGYAKEMVTGPSGKLVQQWVPVQNSVSTSIRAALVGAHGAHVIAPMLYTRDEAIKGWPMTELPRIETEFKEIGYGPTMVHLGWGKLSELGEEWVRVFDGTGNEATGGQ